MDAEPFAAIGRIIKTHGLNGEVSVAPVAEASLADLIGTEVWFVPPRSGVRSSRIVAVRPGPKGPLVTLEGVSSIDAARSVCGAQIISRSGDLPDGWGSAEEEPEDFTGFTVVDFRHGLIGTIVETIVTGANDVWVVDGPLGEVLIPVIDDVVGKIDDGTRMINVTLLEGLLPGEAEEL